MIEIDDNDNNVFNYERTYFYDSPNGVLNPAHEIISVLIIQKQRIIKYQVVDKFTLRLF